MYIKHNYFNSSKRMNFQTLNHYIIGNMCVHRPIVLLWMMP